MTDYCASCGEPLFELPTGGRLACCPRAAMYWSPFEPTPADARGFYQLTGITFPPPQSAWIESWVDGDSIEHVHDPLFLYRSVSGGMT